MDPLLHRAVEGRHTVVIGRGGMVKLEHRPGLGRLEVDCRRLTRPLEPLIAIERHARRLLGPSTALPEDYGLSHRVFGPSADRAVVRDFVNDLNRVAAVHQAPVVIIMHAIQHAHPSTLWALTRLINRSVCKVPIFFGVDRAEGEAIEALVRAVCEVDGPDGILVQEAATGARPSATPSPADISQGAGPNAIPTGAASGEEAHVELGAFPPNVRSILRAGAVLGSPFDVAELAHVARVRELEVLEALQYAADRGIPIEDLGDGRIALPSDLIEPLVQQTLPSLRRAYNARAARVLSETHGGQDVPAVQAERARSFSTVAPSAVLSTPPPDPDPARAADHAVRAGDVDHAVAQHVRAARRATDLGGYEEALALIARADHALQSVPHGPGRRRLQIALDTQLARVHWLAAGAGDAFSLASALDALKRAEQRLEPDDPPTLGAEVRRAIAGVRYDMGDPESLELALEALTTAERALIEAGEPFEAARLLGDEAAVWLRIGDPVRANHLLERAREVFQNTEPRTDETRRAIAETDHLIAKLVLGATPRPGKEREALARATELGRSAREVYRTLGLRADAARTDETLGRLAHRAGHIDEAVAHLSQAAQSQQALGDAIGLARSSEALAEILAEAGDPDSALELLKQSIAMNLQKGSAKGAAFNRQGLRLLLENLPPERRPGFGPLLEHLDSLLRQASNGDESQPGEALRRARSPRP